MLRIAILGASGRMGGALLRLIAADPGLELAGASTEPGDARTGQDAGRLAGLDDFGVELTDDPGRAVEDCDVAVDFTLPAALPANLDACVAAGVPLVIGTTGLGDNEFERLDAAATRIPIVYSRNMSPGITLLTELVRTAARALGVDYDAEITEAHHRDKRDAPSGTALQLGEAVADARGTALSESATWSREGTSEPRARGEIGFQSVRAGRIVGDHRVLLAGENEIVELSHRALDRAVFAQGALRAAQWVAKRAPGRYDMTDVLELAG